MLFWNNIVIFNNSWNNVTFAFWNKYPNNYNKSVLSSNVIDRTVIDNDIKSWRIIETSFLNFLPWKTNTNLLVSEYSILNRIDKTFEVISQNITFSSFITVKESIMFTINNNMFCEMSHNIKIEAFNRIGFLIEKKIIDEIERNSQNGIKALNDIMLTL